MNLFSSAYKKVRRGLQSYRPTRYKRYISDFVLHCHSLDHEDNGMMQNVRIGLSDGSGGIAEGVWN